MKPINRLMSYLNFITPQTHGLVAQWITRLTSNQKIAGSSPAKIVSFCSQVNSYVWTIWRSLSSHQSLGRDLSSHDVAHYTQT